jgi:protein TonB
MFGENLLESSPTARKRKRWPMATAFTVETLIAAVVVIIPLLSTGVIPLSARVQVFTPEKQMPLEPMKPIRGKTGTASGPSSPAPRREFVPVVDHKGSIYLGPPRIEPSEHPPDPNPNGPSVGNGNSLDNLLPRGNGNGVRPGPPSRMISVNSEAQLINRVEPIYPRLAVISGVQGDVKLHAIIARDGRVISVNVISGHPLLVRAAEDAVNQWRYRPYYLNREPVEVETFITVHFTRSPR